MSIYRPNLPPISPHITSKAGTCSNFLAVPSLPPLLPMSTSLPLFPAPDLPSGASSFFPLKPQPLSRFRVTDTVSPFLPFPPPWNWGPTRQGFDPLLRVYSHSLVKGCKIFFSDKLHSSSWMMKNMHIILPNHDIGPDNVNAALKWGICSLRLWRVMRERALREKLVGIWILRQGRHQ